MKKGDNVKDTSDLFNLRCWAIGFDLISLRCQHGLAVVVCRHDIVDDGHQTPERLLLTQKQQDDGGYTVHALSINQVISFNILSVNCVCNINEIASFINVVLVAFIIIFKWVLFTFKKKKKIFLEECHFNFWHLLRYIPLAWIQIQYIYNF